MSPLAQLLEAEVPPLMLDSRPEPESREVAVIIMSTLQGWGGVRWGGWVGGRGGGQSGDVKCGPG